MVGMKKKRRLGSISTPKTGKLREKSPQSGDEVISARDKFKGALQDLLPHSDEESDITDEEQWTSKNSKRTSMQKKKLIERQAEIDPNKEKPMVMKMFDRGVDLAKFNENSPLYPICRAWIANNGNQHFSIKKEIEVKDEIKDEPDAPIPKDGNDFEAVQDVYRMPPPDIPASPSSRIPERIPYLSKYIEIQKEGVEPPSRDDIMNDNLEHWGKVRKSWLDTAAKNESRYGKSIRVLSAMYNKAQRIFQN